MKPGPFSVSTKEIRGLSPDDVTRMAHELESLGREFKPVAVFVKTGQQRLNNRLGDQVLALTHVFKQQSADERCQDLFRGRGHVGGQVATQPLVPQDNLMPAFIASEVGSVAEVAPWSF
jgi:hypothetical protein